MEKSKLVKTENETFKEYYTGERNIPYGHRVINKKVICILDENCVRVVVMMDGKQHSRQEFGNSKRQKEICFRTAENYLK